MKKLLIFVLFACISIACAKEEMPFEGSHPINISVNQLTKANDSVFEADDKVGIYVVNYDDDVAGTLGLQGNHVDNMKFTYSDGAWTPGQPVYWKDKSTPADFYAYYPYDASLSTVTAYPFSVKKDQSNDADFWASDFLWGKASSVAPKSSAVAIETNHRLSRMIVNIKPGTGFSDSEWMAAVKSVKITGIKTSAAIDLSTGVASAQGENGDIVPLQFETKGTIVSYMAMMVPQTVADNSKLIVVTVDGTDYVYRKGFTFKANTQHKFSISVNKNDCSVNVTIGEWEIDDTVNEGVAEEEANDNSNSQISYTATEKVELNDYAEFGAAIVSHTFENGEGKIVFDGDVTRFEGAVFNNNKFITSVKIPNSVTHIGNSVFTNCSNLETVILPDKLISIGENAFQNCEKLSNIDIPVTVTDICNLAFHNCSGMLKIIIPDGVKSIGEKAFGFNTQLKSVSIPSSVQTLGDGVFESCSGLESFQGKFATADSRCLIDENGHLKAFAPYGINSYSIPNGVVRIGDCTFQNCRNLSSITIPESVESIGYSAFNSADNLLSVSLPGKVTRIENWTFTNCYSLETIEIHDGITYIGEYAFAHCTSFEGMLLIPETVESIGVAAFFGCNNLSGFQGKYASSDNRCLIDDLCNLLAVAPKGLEEYSIPENVVKICTGISISAGIKRMIIPSGVIRIEDGAFLWGESLEEVICNANEVPGLGSIAFDGLSSACILKVPAGCKTKYENSDWKNWFSTIEEIE